MSKGCAPGFALIFVMWSGAFAATLTVTNTNDNLVGSLRQAIQDASPGDAILFNIPTSDPGFNSATATWVIGISSAELAIAKNLTIDGGGQRITLQYTGTHASPGGRVFNLTGGVVTISRLTIANGFVTSGSGGTIFNGATLTLSACTITGSYALGSGGGIYNTGTLTLQNCTLTNNNCDTYGAGIGNGGVLTMRSCTVASNTAPSTNGGGISNLAGTAEILSSVIALNNASRPGNRDVDGSFISDGYNFIGVVGSSTGFGNSGSHDQVGTIGSPADPKLAALADNGGPTSTMMPMAGSPLVDQGLATGLTNDQIGRPRILDDPAVANAGGGDGSDIGAVERDLAQPGPTFTVTNTDERSDGVCGVADCTLIEALDASNAASDANTILFAPGVAGTITTNKLTSSGLSIANPVTIIGPGARTLALSGSNAGRCILNFSTGVTISGLGFVNSAISDRAAAIYSSGGLALKDCMFTGNTVSNGGGSAIWVEPGSGNTLTLERCTFSGNQVGTGGGTLYVAASELVTVTNCTFYNNTAQFGAAIYNFGGTTTLQHCTVSANTASGPSGGGSTGGALRNANSGVVNLGSTIVAGNFAGASVTIDLDGAFNSLGYNLIGKINGGSGLANGVNHDQVGTAGVPLNPQLDPAGLQNNGGVTDTIGVLANSTAVNNGDPANNPLRDQRGFARAGASDIGAFEFLGKALQITSIIRSGQDILITFPALQSETYHLQRKLQLSDPAWQPIGSDLTAGSTGQAQFTDTGGATPGHGFYRVRLIQ